LHLNEPIRHDLLNFGIMKIRQIVIKNFKGFASQTFDLNDQFTVFIGDNATGKTSILDALAVVLGGFFIEIAEVNSRTIKEKEVRVIDIEGQPRPQKPVIIEAFGTVSNREISWKREIINKKTTSKDSKPLSRIAKEMLDKSRKENGVIFPLIAYHGTGRLWAEHEKVDFQKQEEGIKMAYTNCLSAKSSSKEFLSWYKTQEDSIQKFSQPRDIAHLKAFKETILKLIPDNRWQDMAFDRKVEDLMGIFRDNEGQQHKLAYSQLSDGYRNTIGLAADIAYRCIQLNPHLGENAVVDTPGIVLIDELDLHLHPNWQRHVVADLKNAFPNIQFVATTHSPFIVQSLEADELINLDKAVDTTPNDLSINEISVIFMGLESEFSEKSELLEQESIAILQNLHEQQPVAQHIEHISNPAVRAFLELSKMANGQ
jgi:predicted ATP-binding protein involved in virulence